MVIANQEKSFFSVALMAKGWTPLTMQTTFMYTLCVNHLSKNAMFTTEKRMLERVLFDAFIQINWYFYLIVRLYDILHIESLRADGFFFFLFSHHYHYDLL